MFKYAVLFSAVAIALCAAFFSVTGIGQLFAGASLAAILMASSLELGKLVTVSFIYRHWGTLQKGLRAYFFVAALILMAITSTGIYGYLMSAYSKGAVDFIAGQGQVDAVATQETYIGNTIKNNLDRITVLQNIRIQQENRLDKLVGQRGLATQQQIISNSDKDIRNLQAEDAKLSIKKDSLSSARITSQNTLNKGSKIATLAYIAKILNTSLDNMVRWFVLLIVLVFDPLSVSLIIAYNILVKDETTEGQNNTEDSTTNIPEIIADIPTDLQLDEQVIDTTPDYMRQDYDWNNATPEALHWKRNTIQSS